MLIVEGASKSYRKSGRRSGSRHQALREVSFQWSEGECLGIIGESGSGKSTLGRLLLGLEKPDSGSITFDGKSVSRRQTRQGAISAVFQNYAASIHPFFTVCDAVMEPLKLSGKKVDFLQLERLMKDVGLDQSYLTKYPHQLSGGEAQRVCIARAIASQPRCIVLDEAVSSLDGPVQMQVLELLAKLKASYGMGYIFITHDLLAAAYLCDRMLVIRDGEIIEAVDTPDLKRVQTPYAQELLRKVMV